MSPQIRAHYRMGLLQSKAFNQEGFRYCMDFIMIQGRSEASKSRLTDSRRFSLLHGFCNDSRRSEASKARLRTKKSSTERNLLNCLGLTVERTVTSLRYHSEHG